MSGKVPMRFDLEMMKWVANKIESKDYSVFPFEVKECEKCGATYHPQLGHDCNRIVELQMNVVDAEPQTKCQKCKSFQYNGWYCVAKANGDPCHYEPKGEPQTDCSWK
jgi:hypothetical protein